MAQCRTAPLLAFLVALSLLLDCGNGAREAAVHGFGAPKLGRAAGSMGKTEESQLWQVPSGPNPLHHNGIVTGAREAAVHEFGAPKRGRAAGSMGKTEEWQLWQVPSGPNPLHHKGSPRKPQTP